MARRVDTPHSSIDDTRTHRAGLDLEAVAAWLRSKVKWPDDCQLQSLRINRLWAGRRGRVTLELALSLTHGGSSAEFMIQGGLGEPARPGTTHRRAILSQHGLLGLRLESREAGIWLCSPDRDRRVPLVTQLLSDEGVASLTSKLALPWPSVCSDGERSKRSPTDDADSSLDALLVAHRVNRRYVVRVRSRNSPEAPGLFFKAFRRPPATDTLAYVGRLAGRLTDDADGVLRLPTLVRHGPDQRLVVTAEVPRDARPLGTSSPDTTLAGAALATLHGHTSGASCLPTHTPSAELATVARWIPALDKVSGPEDAARLARVVESLARDTDEVPGSATSLLHRDFYHAQLMRSGGTLWFMDLDTLCLGHGELDLSTFLAHTWLDVLRDDHDQTSLGDTSIPLLDGYVSHGGGIDRARLRYYLPCALARLAALQFARGLSRETVERMWTLAERLLENPLALDEVAPASLPRPPLEGDC